MSGDNALKSLASAFVIAVHLKLVWCLIFCSHLNLVCYLVILVQ